MAARTSADAATTFFDALQKATSCVSEAVLQGRAYHAAPTLHSLFFAQGAVKLGRGGGLMLRVRLGYRLQELPGDANGWQVVTVGYAYRLLHRSGQTIMSYQWHPVGNSPVTHPHLHVSGRAGSVDLSKAHLPTGQVSLIAVVRMTITELGVEPLRDDWDTVLDQAERDLARQ